MPSDEYTSHFRCFDCDASADGDGPSVDGAARRHSENPPKHSTISWVSKKGTTALRFDRTSRDGLRGDRVIYDEARADV